MSHDTDRTLWCLVKGESTPFKVVVPVSVDIADMKEKIKLKKAPELDHLDANSLHVWKVRTLWRQLLPCQLIRSWQLNDPIPIKPEATLGDRIRAHTSDLSQLADKLDSSDEVSDIFPSHVPKKHLHIILQLPPTGECGLSLSSPPPQI